MRSVSVILPTKALAARAGLLEGAIQSILTQDGVHPIPIVVVNGSEADSHLVRSLQQDSRIVLVFRDRASIPSALRAGREQAMTPYITTLDDDDALLPGGLAARVDALEARPEWDAVITNGIVRRGNVQAIKNPDTEAIRRDPVRAMFRANWILPGGWLSRTEALGPEVFDSMPDFLECTWLGLWLVTCRRVGFLELPTLIRVRDTPAATCQTEAFLRGQAGAHRALLALDLPLDVQREVHRRITAACHSTSRHYLRARAFADAWSWHLRTLGEPAGWRYLRYTGRLVLTQLGLLK